MCFASFQWVRINCVFTDNFLILRLSFNVKMSKTTVKCYWKEQKAPFQSFSREYYFVMSTFIVTMSNRFFKCKGGYSRVGQYYVTTDHQIKLLLHFKFLSDILHAWDTHLCTHFMRPLANASDEPDVSHSNDNMLSL